MITLPNGTIDFINPTAEFENVGAVIFNEQ